MKYPNLIKKEPSTFIRFPNFEKFFGQGKEHFLALPQFLLVVEGLIAFGRALQPRKDLRNVPFLIHVILLSHRFQFIFKYGGTELLSPRIFFKIREFLTEHFFSKIFIRK
jgi:hypothetical protein